MRQKDRFLLLLVLASLPIGRMAAEELESNIAKSDSAGNPAKFSTNNRNCSRCTG